MTGIAILTFLLKAELMDMFWGNSSTTRYGVGDHYCAEGSFVLVIGNGLSYRSMFWEHIRINADSA